MQERAGEREAALRTGSMVGTALPSRAIPFLAQQRMLALGAMDERGNVCASVLFGRPGFVSSLDGTSVVLDRTRLDAGCHDWGWSGLYDGADVGLLAIELATRRRLRMNGTVRAADARRVEIDLREVYPNCPKYVQRRRPDDDPSTAPADCPPPTLGVAVDSSRSQLIERADTLFVASRHPARGVDVSHRGGAPGFVRVVDPRRLRIPDYPGNSMFNTLGNFMVDSRAGLAFLDFQRGLLLRMSGTVTVLLDQDEDPRQPAGGTGRYWEFHIAGWVEAAMPTKTRWELHELSPYNPRTPS